MTHATVRRAILAGAVTLAAAGAARADGNASADQGILRGLIQLINAPSPTQAKLDLTAVTQKIDSGTQKVGVMNDYIKAHNPSTDVNSIPPGAEDVLGTFESQLRGKVNAVMLAQQQSNQAQDDLKKVKDLLTADANSIQGGVSGVNGNYDALTKAAAKTDATPPAALDAERFPVNQTDHVAASVIDQDAQDAGTKITSAQNLVTTYSDPAQCAGKAATNAACPALQQKVASALTSAHDAVKKMRDDAAQEVNALQTEVANDITLSQSAVSNADKANPGSICKGVVAAPIQSAGVKSAGGAAPTIQAILNVAREVAEIESSITYAPSDNPCLANPPTKGIAADAK